VLPKNPLDWETKRGSPPSRECLQEDLRKVRKERQRVEGGRVERRKQRRRHLRSPGLGGVFRRILEIHAKQSEKVELEAHTKKNKSGKTDCGNRWEIARKPGKTEAKKIYKYKKGS